MATIKSQLTELIQEQPEDATYEELMQELAFSRMVERGLFAARSGKVISNSEMSELIKSWQK